MMKNIELNESELNISMLGVGALEELRAARAERKEPDMLVFMLLNIFSAVCTYAYKSYNQSTEDMAIVEEIMEEVKGSTVFEKAMRRLETIIDTIVSDMEVNANGCKPS